jgi:hypothetical protein
MEEIFMRVQVRDEESIVFDNGTVITYSHNQDCCEYNFADFSQLDNTGFDEFNFPDKLTIEIVDEFGFRVNGFFIPCYSDQNGYYSSDIDICVSYPDETYSNFNFCCEERDG